MRIIFRLSALGFGGTERVFISVADALLASYGWHSTFVVDRISDSATESVACGRGHRIIGLGVSRTWQSILPFAKVLRDEKPDIVLSAYTETNGAALISRILSGLSLPIVVTEHASLDEHWKGKSRFRRLLLEAIVRQVYKFADHILCVSAGLAAGVTRRQKAVPVSYIHNPVRFDDRRLTKEEAREALKVASDVRMVLAVGRISRQKNYTTLLKGMAELRANNAHLYIVGGVFDATEKTQLDVIIQDLGLASRVHFINFTHEIHQFYAAADLLVLSSAWEGFGNVLVEGLAFGLPIVSTRCNHGPAEILADGQYGRLVPVGNAHEMAQAIDEVLMENPFPAALQIRRSQDFSEASIGTQYHSLISRIAGRMA